MTDAEMDALVARLREPHFAIRESAAFTQLGSPPSGDDFIGTPNYECNRISYFPTESPAQAADAITALRERLAVPTSESVEAMAKRLESWPNDAAIAAGNLHDTATAIRALDRERAELRVENAAIRELMNVYNLGGWTDAIAPTQRALAAEAALAAAAQDAERYRWLRDKDSPVYEVVDNCPYGEKLDAAIDAARKAQP